MSAATWWWVLAGGLAVAELLSGSFFLLALALAPVAGAIAATFGLPFSAQMAAAAVAGGGAVVAWGAWRRRQPRVDAQSSPDVQMDVGQRVQVEAWDPDGTTQVRYRGVTWQARRAEGAAHQTGAHHIVAVQGNVLQLKPASPAEPGASSAVPPA